MRSPWQLGNVCREEQLVQYVTTSTDYRTGPLQGVLGLGCAAADTAPRILHYAGAEELAQPCPHRHPTPTRRNHT